MVKTMPYPEIYPPEDPSYHPIAAGRNMFIEHVDESVAATILAIVCSPLFGGYPTILEGLVTLICYLAPPITAVFLLGVFWRQASGRGVFLTLVVGTLLGAAAFFLDWFKEYTGWTIHPMMASFYLFAFSMGLGIIASLWMPQAVKEEARLLVWSDWREPLRGPVGGKTLGDYRFLAAAIAATFVVLYYVFR